MLKGITCAGSSFVDINKIIDEYPDKNTLSYILSTSKSTGGSVCNTIMDLNNIDSSLPLSAISAVGDDANGEYIKKNLKDRKIDVSGIRVKKNELTGFTDVMTEKNTGHRTFFTHKGANSSFDLNDLNIDNIQSKIFHIGYIFLLDKLDSFDQNFGTVMAKALSEIQAKGIKTSIDLVTKKNANFQDVVIPSLKYCNYLIVNETEAGLVVDMNPLDKEGKISENNIRQISQKIIDLGVQDLVIIHAPEGGWAMDKNYNFYNSRSFHIPDEKIESTVGAGDAFCAGALYSIYNEISLKKTLEFSNACAAMSLTEKSSFLGVKSYREIEKFIMVN